MADSSVLEIAKQIKETFETYAVVATASIAVLGFAWGKLVTNRDRARRLGQINRSFQDITKILTTSTSEKERLAAAILLRRFFDKEGEYSIHVMFRKEIPYAKAALELMTALLKIELVGPVQKALADSLVLSDSLRSTDMQRANLSQAYLGRRGAGDKSSAESGVLLRGVDLHLANVKAYFRRRGAGDCSSAEAGIVLRGADLFMADLSGASLRRADCAKAVFTDAKMKKTVLDEADLSGANFKGAKLMGARFKTANLKNANFSYANLSNANFFNADLTEADFTGATLTGADFTNADLTRAHFSDGDLKTTKFSGAKNPPAQLTNVSNNAC